MKNFAYGIHENEKILLTKSINMLQEFLGCLINESNKSRIFGDFTGNELVEAWHDMPSHFEEIRVKLAIKDQLALSLHGLNGGQLKLKLALIDFFMNKYRDSLAKNGFDPVTKQRLRQLLISLNILVLDMIQATDSGGAVASLQECLITLLE